MRLPDIRIVNEECDNPQKPSIKALFHAPDASVGVGSYEAQPNVAEKKVLWGKGGPVVIDTLER